MIRRLLATVPVVLMAALGCPRALRAAATATFAPDNRATHPNTVKVAGKAVTVDLAAVAKAEVYRAALAPRREVLNGQDRRAMEPVRVMCGGKALELLPPRCGAFDATQAVREALKAGTTATFQIESLPGWDGRSIRLEVTTSDKAAVKVPPVTALAARHRAGQTILTFREVEPTVKAENITVEQLRAARKELAGAARRVTYRIYRSAEPITPETVARARLVDEIDPLSCWNDEYHGVYPRKDAPALRYAVEDGKGPVPPGTGVYAHNPAEARQAYYAVTAAVNGAEDLDAIGKGNTCGPVDETPGAGEPVLQRVENPREFNYVRNPALRYYVRWEAPPRCNVPSRPFDYVVAIPENPKWPAPVNLAFHCWGANLNGGYGWWYQRPPATTVLVATNQVPYDWWTGYHDSLGTGRPWSEGTVRSYTFARLEAFYEWVCSQWPIDRTRTVAGGNSMGGSGAPVYATHHPDQVAWVSSWVGVHVPAKTPHFLGSYELCYGRLDWKLKHESGQAAFDHFDDAAWVRGRPGESMPLICFGNGKDDGAIGWPQALEYFRALQEARQPHVFHWALGGHGVRATLPGPGASGSSLALDVRTDQSLPAFTACSLDGQPGTGKLLPAPREVKCSDGHIRKDAYDGDHEGHANRWLYWDTKAIVDEPNAWEMTVLLVKEAPSDDCAADVTPRRCQKFRPKPGQALAWTATAPGGDKPIQSGQVTVDPWGRVTLEKVTVTKAGRRLRISPAGP